MGKLCSDHRARRICKDCDPSNCRHNVMPLDVAAICDQLEMVKLFGSKSIYSADEFEKTRKYAARKFTNSENGTEMLKYLKTKSTTRRRR